MKKNLFDSFLRLLSNITKKHVTYVSGKNIKATNLAAKSKYGFWYCGNVFDQGDVAYGVANNGEVESFDSSVVEKILRHLNKEKEYTFYDIGANTGWYTLLASSIGKGNTVHSFEPISEYVDILSESVKLNSKETLVSIHNFALSNENTFVNIRLAGSGSSLEKDFLSIDRGLRKIETKTLDSFTKEANIPGPDFIKIDVEGHEYKVLEGAIETIGATKPVLFIEIAYTLRTVGSSFVHKDYDSIFSSLEKIGYVSYMAKNEQLIKCSSSDKQDGVYMFLFLHREKHSSIIDFYK